jgi:hypothetical protein
MKINSDHRQSFEIGMRREQIEAMNTIITSKDDYEKERIKTSNDFDFVPYFPFLARGRGGRRK